MTSYKMSYCALPTLLAVLLAIPSFAQENDPPIAKWVKTLLERDRSPRVGNTDYGPLLRADPNQAYAALVEYRNHTNEFVQADMLRYMMKVKESHPNPAFDRKLVKLMLEIFNEKCCQATGVVMLCLPTFDKACFGKEEKDLIRKAFREKEVSKESLELVSIAQIKEDLPELKKRFDSIKWREDSYPKDPISEKEGLWAFRPKWKFRELLATYGDEESIVYCLDRIDNAEVAPKGGLLANCLPKIKDVRSVAMLKKYLHSDASMTFSDQAPLPIRACAAKGLAALLSNFPVAVKTYYEYTPEEIVKCQKWMDLQTEWKFREQ